MSGRRRSSPRPDRLETKPPPEMIEAGVLAMSKYDCRFEPPDVAVFRIFRSILETTSPKIAIRVVLAPDVERCLSPYLESEEGTLSY